MVDALRDATLCQVSVQVRTSGPLVQDALLTEY
jgi:hypothetical protein